MKKQTKKPLQWVRLDNAAKIYPAARRKGWSNVFRPSDAAQLCDVYHSGVGSPIGRVFAGGDQCLATGGHWFLSFALPVVGGLCLVTTAAVTLLRYIRRGRLYIHGGVLAALGGWLLLLEYLMGVTFGVRFIGWSVYPLLVLALLGGLLIYVAIDSDAREMLKRKLFF